MPAGGYALVVRGYTADANAKLHATLSLHPAGGAADQPLGSIDSTPPPPGGGLHLQNWIQTTLCAPALSPQPGDGLLLDITYVSGSSAFTVLETTFSIP